MRLRGEETRSRDGFLSNVPSPSLPRKECVHCSLQAGQVV